MTSARWVLPISIVGACVVAPWDARGDLPAFPGAEGFGASSVGGRGGRIIKVTNLNASGPGSLQAACEAQGPRTVVFEVGGVIRGDIAIKHPFITIAGQTAPGPGITVEGRLLVRPQPWRRLHDIIVRFLRIRPPPTTGHTGDTVQLPDTERVILDHLSLSWANDETIDIIHASEVTIQWSTIEESDMEGHAKGEGHNFGIISAYPGSGNISIHHNLFAHHSRRSPSLTPYVAGKPGDFRNNVVYNFREGLTHDGHVPREAINLVGNYYKRGPSSASMAPFVFHPEGRYFLEGNAIDGIGSIEDLFLRRADAPVWLSLDRKGMRLTAPAAIAAVRTQSADDAYRMVLRLAGSFPRDRVTIRTVGEVAGGSGAWGRHAPAAPSDAWYLAGIRRGYTARDSDGDGMPDEWEDANGLDRRDGRDHDRPLRSGYTAIETYINEQAEALVSRGDADVENVVLLGASYVRGWPIHELRGRRVINRGVAGEQSGEMLQRFEQDVLPARPGAVVVWGFINDIHRSSRADIEPAMARARANIEAMVRLARMHGIRPILATEVTIRGSSDLRDVLAAWVGRIRSKASYQQYVNEHVLATNAWIRNFARDNGVPILDFQPLIAEEGGLRKREFATHDGTHISTLGYAALTTYAEETLASTLTP